MTKKVAISTWCTDDYVDLIGLDKLHNKYFYYRLIGASFFHLLVYTSIQQSPHLCSHLINKMP